MYGFSLVGCEKLWSRSALIYAKLRARIQMKSLCHMGKYLKYVNQTYNLSNKTSIFFILTNIYLSQQSLPGQVRCFGTRARGLAVQRASPGPGSSPLAPTGSSVLHCRPHAHIGDPAPHPRSVPTPSNSHLRPTESHTGGWSAFGG